MRAHEPHVRGLARALRAVDRDHRLPGDRREARRAGRRRTAARSTSAGRSAASCGAAPTSSSARTAATCSARQVVVCAGLRCDELAAGVGRRPRRADHPVPRRVLRVRRARRRAGQGPDLPGARPGVPVPRRARHPGDRRQRARRPERRARAGPRGLLVGRREAQGAARVAGLPRHAAARAASTGATGSARCTGRCRARRWSARSSGCCPTSAPTTCTRPAPGCGPRRCGRTAALVDDFLFVAQGDAVRARCCTCSTPRHPAATAALPIGREILETLTGEKLGPL